MRPARVSQFVPWKARECRPPIRHQSLASSRTFSSPRFVWVVQCRVRREFPTFCRQQTSLVWASPVVPSKWMIQDPRPKNLFDFLYQFLSPVWSGLEKLMNFCAGRRLNGVEFAGMLAEKCSVRCPRWSAFSGENDAACQNDWQQLHGVRHCSCCSLV